MVDHVHTPKRDGPVEHRLGLACVHGRGLLAEHVRSGVEGRERHLGMGHGRRRDADEIQLMVGQHAAPVVIGVRNAERRGGGIRARLAGARDGHNLRSVYMA